MMKALLKIISLTCLLISCISWMEAAYGQDENDITFSALTTMEGLSQSSVNAILKDRFGFMWFGTQDGLNRYDGYSFYVYRNNPHHPGSLPDNQVKCLHEDADANIWIGTLGSGLCIYDRDRDRFVRPEEMGFHSDRPIDPAILCMYEDREKNLWVGTFQGLLLIDRHTKTIRHFMASPGDAHSLSNNIIQAIFEDAFGRIWIGTNKGLDLFNRQAGAFQQFFHDEKNPASISNDEITAITGDVQGYLWLGTNGGGLNRMDSKTGSFMTWKNAGPAGISSNIVRALQPTASGKLWVGTEDGLNLLDPRSGQCLRFGKTLIGEGGLNDNSILSLQEDSSGILWVGTSKGGVDKWDRNLFHFELYRKTSDPNSLSGNKVTSFAEGPRGEIYIGTDGDGLNCWEPSTRQFRHFRSGPNGNRTIEGSAILSLLISRNKNCLWIGTYGDGLEKLDLTTGIVTHYHAGTGPHDLSSSSIYALLEDRQGRLWMGTNGGGVDMLDPESGMISSHHYASRPDSISNNYIRCLMQDKQGRIWIGTYSSGISVYDPATGKFSLYDKMNNSLSNQVVFSLCEDSKGRIWAGTMGGGLDLFDPQTRHFTTFNEEDGLGNNIVNSIIEDGKERLWLSTNKGITLFEPDRKQFRNFTVSNGLQDPEFMIGAGFRSSEGSIFFGGIRGFNVFDPLRERRNKRAPVTRFTSFFLFNKQVEPGSPGSPLKGDLNTINDIVLAHDQSDFTIGFAALNYTAPEENKYAYMLDGFDKGWSYSTERKATYTNLSPGKYTFRVKAANNDGVWNEQSSNIPIIITPPFWKTWWAWLLYTLIVGTILYLIYKDISDKEKLKGQIRIERLTAEKMKELNNIKLNFFTHVSHELRTPLSLIIDPLRKIIREDPNPTEIKKYGQLMYDNAQRLMNLVNQMLDFRKLEEGHLQLNRQTVDIVLLTRQIASFFDVHATERAISFSVTATTTDIQVKVDQDKFEKIIFNLLSNAFKYTPDKGAITVNITRNDTNAIIHVIDTGIGIPPHLKDRIFEPFFQVEGAREFEKGATGIGLALAKELADLHHGRITVESEIGKGSNFTLSLPLTEDLVENAPASSPGSVQPAPDLVNNLHAQPAAAPQDAKEILLLVEDNKDLREYIKGELNDLYTVETARNGMEGYEKAISIIPDLIISDIMMPEVSGLELCQQVKTDQRTSHIPVILLTARQADIHQIEGYDAGADAYIPKPFNIEVVLSCIKSQLASRKRLREKYRQWQHPAMPEKQPDVQVAGQDSPTEENTALPEMGILDRAFIEKATRITEENLADLTFDIDKLALALKVSRRQLYRKLKALTDLTAHDFVTDIRLKKAAALLLTGEYTIAEIAYKVGYSEPANFSRTFTKAFGKSPKKYLAEYNRPS